MQHVSIQAYRILIIIRWPLRKQQENALLPTLTALLTYDKRQTNAIIWTLKKRKKLLIQVLLTDRHLPRYRPALGAGVRSGNKVAISTFGRTEARSKIICYGAFAGCSRPVVV